MSHRLVTATRRGWILICVMAAVAGIVGAAVRFITPETYVAETRVLVFSAADKVDVFGVRPPKPGVPEEELVATQAELMRSRRTMEDVIERLGLPVTVKELSERVEVSPVGRSAVVAVRVTSDSPEQARRVADEIAKGYVRLTTQLRLDAMRRMRATLEAGVERARSDLREIDDRAGVQGLSIGDAVERQILSDRLLGLSREIEQLRVAEQVERGWGEVVDPAWLPDRPAGASIPVAALSGVLAGALLGFSLAAYREFRVDSSERAALPRVGKRSA